MLTPASALHLLIVSLANNSDNYLNFIDAPEDYMPNGFDESDQFYKLDSSIMNMELGTMCGGHHKIQVLAASHLIKQGRAAVDLNQTSVSMNQSILNTPNTKVKDKRLILSKHSLFPEKSFGGTKEKKIVIKPLSAIRTNRSDDNRPS